MQKVNDCFSKVKKDCFKFISSQETKEDKFKNKEKMIKSFLIPVSFWIIKRINNSIKKFYYKKLKYCKGQFLGLFIRFNPATNDRIW